MLRQLSEWDRPVLFDYLLRNEEETAFIIGNAEQCGILNRRNVLRCGDYIGYFEGNSLKGVIVFYNLGNCFLHYESMSSVSYFSQLMLMRKFSMLIGTERLIRPIFEVVRRDKPIRELEECSYCINENFTPFKLEGAEFIDVTEEADVEILEFIRKAYLRGFGAERSVEGTRLLLSQSNIEEDFILLSIDGRLLAQACIQAFTDSTNQIGAVYTLEEERGKGYGKAVVSELCERIIGRGKLPTLIANKKNLPALSAYKALGFEHRDDYIIIRL